MKIAVVGLGYVGLPLALEFAKNFPGTVGFDINEERVNSLKAGHDSTGETADDELSSSSLTMTTDPSELKGCDFFVVGVPTPVDINNNPELSALRSATRTVGKALCKNSIVVFESTVYPGVTEDICGKILEEVSGLKCGVDFKLGYSPERINPGDKEHSLTSVIKVVSGQDEETLETIAKAYSTVVKAGVHKAPSIKVAEAAKVIENTQRDLNIALMNELAIIFDRMNIPTHEVLKAAGTKWNFLNFRPGLVGGHCIGVDPYYLTTCAEQLGYHPEVILAGRRINDNMGKYIAERTVKMMVNAGMYVRNASIGVLGVTFKEDVSDIRNSRVPGIIAELKEFGCEALVHDPLAEPDEIEEEYGLRLSPISKLSNLDALILAVPHKEYLKDKNNLIELVKPGGIVIDIKSILSDQNLPENIDYWCL